MRRSNSPAIPKADADDRRHFESLVPEHPAVVVRPMFGNLAAFVNGNMFFGLLGHAMCVRLGADERAELLAEPGASVFEPMKGRPMKEYVQLPASWRKRPELTRAWVRRSLDWAAALPAKTKAKPRRSR